MKQVYDVSNDEKIYSNFLKFLSFDPLDDIEAVVGFLSQRMLAGFLLRILGEVDYSKEEIQNFIAINLCFTTLINLR